MLKGENLDVAALKLARSLNAIVLTLGGNLDAAALKLARNLSAAPIGSLDIIITFALAKPSLSQLLRFLQEPITAPPCC